MLMILLASVKGDEEKRILTSFYKTHNDGLFRYALSILRNPSLAEEALSTSWLKCMEHMETFFSVPEEKRLYWMVVVVKNTALSLKEREKRHDSMDSVEWEPPAPEIQDPQHRQGHQDIVNVIRSMPAQYRTILELKFLQEWNSQQIADYMGLTVNTVNTRISRGRKLLQETLRKEGYDYV
ncbi:MAG: RNA polymerase sigma factor [Evtepia sp.]|nr:RNA polymerase sigma factor [Evtepia sp.]